MLVSYETVGQTNEPTPESVRGRVGPNFRFPIQSCFFHLEGD